jgi:hypothetical protein
MYDWKQVQVEGGEVNSMEAFTVNSIFQYVREWDVPVM